MRQTGPDQALVELGVDYTRAQVPDRAYYADYCNVERSRVGLTLTFGKLSGTQDALRTKIEVVFPEEMFQKQLWGTSGSLRQTLRQLTQAKPLAPLSKVADTDKVQTFRSNNVFMAVWGQEGVLDFYYISPRDYYLFQVRQGADIGLEPIVRVSMDSALMKEFMDRCEAFVDESAKQAEAQEGPAEVHP